MKNLTKKLSYAISIVLAFGVYSCSNTEDDPTNDLIENTQGKWEHQDGDAWSTVDYRVEEIEIDMCDYIMIFGVEGRSIIHKANCANPCHTKR